MSNKIEKPIHQKLLLAIALVLVGFLALGQVLDAVGNARSLIDKKVAFLGTVLMLVVGGVIELWTRKRGVTWLTKNKSLVRIKRVTWQSRFPLLGVIILLWIPTFIKLWHHPMVPNVETATTNNTPINTAPMKSVSVVVAEFQGPNPEQYGVTQILTDGLERLPSKGIDLKIEHLRELIDSKESAERRGRELNAKIVIWGNYMANESHAQVTANFTMPDSPSFLPYISNPTTIRSSIAQLRSFTIQDKISTRMRYLTLLTSALAVYVAGDYAEAAKKFDSAIGEAPNQSDSYISYFFRGTAHGFTNNYQASIEDLTRCIRLRPRWVEAYNNLGIAFAETDKHERAIELFRRAIQIKPDHVNAYVNLGGEYLDKGWYKQAADEFNKAIYYDPTNRKALVLLAETNYELGNDDAAISILNKVSKLGQDDYYYTLLGALYLRRENFALAVSNFQKALALTPESGAAHCNLARAYAERGNSEQAITHYTKAIQSRPSADLHHDRGLAYYVTGRANEAVTDFKKAIELDAKLADAYFGLSYAYLVLGRGELAAEAADNYIRINRWHENRAKYMAVVRYLGLVESNKVDEAKRIVEQATQHCDKSAWPCPIVNYLRRRVTWQEVLKEANEPVRVGTAITTNQRKVGLYTPPGRRLPTEAHTYIALNLALTVDKSQAYPHLQWVHDYGERRSFEYQLALSKLNQLKK